MQRLKKNFKEEDTQCKSHTNGLKKTLGIQRQMECTAITLVVKLIMKPWAFKGELIKSVKEDYVGIKKIAERSGYAFRGRYHDPELNDLYYEDVYYKNCMVAADGSPIKYGKGNSSVLIAGSVGFGPFVSIRVYNKRAYNYIKSELRNKFHFKTEEVDGKWTTLKKGNVVIDVSVDGNAYCFTIYTK